MTLSFDINYTMINSNFNKFFFISDMHFCHKNIDELAEREEGWVETLMSNWNNTVSEDSTVFIVGDACLDIKKYSCCKEYISKLNGRKILIRGNHDRYENGKLLSVGYEFVLSNLFIKVMAKSPFNIYVQHIPPAERDIESLMNKMRRYPHVVVHGHVHRKKPFVYTIKGVKFINVSVEVVNYTPISLEEIIKIYKER